MNGDLYSSMPDTTSRMAPYRRSLRLLMASTLLFSSSLLLVTSMGLAQPGDVPARAQFADSMEGSEDLDRGALANEGEEDNDDLSGDDQYRDDVSANQPQQTPATGGIALLPLAGSALTAGAGGFVLLRRR